MRTTVLADPAQLGRAEVADVVLRAQQAQLLAAEPDEPELVPRVDLPHLLRDVEDRRRAGRVVEHPGAVDRVQVRVDDRRRAPGPGGPPRDGGVRRRYPPRGTGKGRLWADDDAAAT